MNQPMMRCPLRTALVLIVTAWTAAPLVAEEKDQGKVVSPFNGKNLDGWKLKKPEGSKWVAGTATLNPENPGQIVVAKADPKVGELINAERSSVDIFTEQAFGDCTVSLEVMVPKGSNSGIYMMGNYEVQVLDSYGKKTVGAGDIGGIYGAAAPKVNASKKPGEWQEFIIEFQAPRFTDGKKVANAVFKKVTLNKQVIHENVEVKGAGGGNLGGGENPTGPLMFQGDHGPVAYRNIRISVPDAK
jgi:hypothetical protein